MSVLVHTMPAPPIILLPCVKGLNLRPQPITTTVGHRQKCSCITSRRYYNVAGSVAILTVPEPAML